VNASQLVSCWQSFSAAAIVQDEDVPLWVWVAKHASHAGDGVPFPGGHAAEHVPLHGEPMAQPHSFSS
jgi:hypothetical protein